MGCGGLDALNPVCQAGSLVTSTVTSVATSAFNAVAGEFAKVASAAVVWLWGQLSYATSIQLGGPGFHSDLAATGAIALVVTTILFLAQVIVSALRREPGGLGRALRGLVVSFLGASFAVATIGILLGLVDALSSGVVEFTLHTNLQGLGQKLVAVTALSAMSPAAVLLISLVLLAAVVVVWAALMIRKLLVIVAAVFAPVAFSGASADVTRSWVRRWIELTVALVASKLVLVVIFMIGLSVLDGTGRAGKGAGQSVTQLMVGVLLLLLGGLSPWMAVKLVHFAGDSFATLHGHAGVAAAGGRQAIAAPQKLASASQQVRRYAPMVRVGREGDGWSAGSGSPAASTGSGPSTASGPSGSPAPTDAAGFVSADAGTGRPGRASSTEGPRRARVDSPGSGPDRTAGPVASASANESGIASAKATVDGPGRPAARTSGAARPTRVPGHPTGPTPAPPRSAAPHSEQRSSPPTTAQPSASRPMRTSKLPPQQSRPSTREDRS